MDAGKLARGLALNRISFGAGLILAPGLYARSRVGSAAAEDTTKVLARALGARDLALRAGDRERARRWYIAQGATDAIDLLASTADRSGTRALSALIPLERDDVRRALGPPPPASGSNPTGT